MVNLVNYTNPSGRCAECQKPLNISNIEGTIPVCCDELPYKSGNCDNTGDARCDTRFRWTIRPFGASLETRPASIHNADNPPYFFTDCVLSPTSCPFSDMSAIFSQGPTDFLGVTDNPLTVSRLDITTWTVNSQITLLHSFMIYSFSVQGRIQFYIEPVDSGLPNIIDSLLVNLDSLQLGGDFTEEMMFTGFHNIATMTMSFRVECSPGFCGPYCTTTPTNNPLVAECQADGSVTCVDNRRDPLHHVPCSDCLYNLNSATNCTTCLSDSSAFLTSICNTCLNSNFTNCPLCIKGYDLLTNCTECLPNRDPSTDCTQCLPGWDIDSDCTQCLLPNRDPLTNCTECLPNRDPSTDCTQCLPGWDIDSDCTQCLPNRDPATNCSLCLQPDRFTDTTCTVCATTGADPATLCETCLIANYDLNTNCIQCKLNRNITTNCSTCLSGWDGRYECRVCLTRRNISTDCTTCIPGYSGADCTLGKYTHSIHTHYF